MRGGDYGERGLLVLSWYSVCAVWRGNNNSVEEEEDDKTE